jgi:hypothetical protein
VSLTSPCYGRIYSNNRISFGAVIEKSTVQAVFQFFFPGEAYEDIPN